jgi:hypothetical protein
MLEAHICTSTSSHITACPPQDPLIGGIRHPCATCTAKVARLHLPRSRALAACAPLPHVQGETYVFMNMTTYEEVRVPRDDAWAKWLQEGVECNLQLFNGTVIGVEPPKVLIVQARQPFHMNCSESKAADNMMF